MPVMIDGPASPLFKALKLNGNMSLGALADAGVSAEMVSNTKFAPAGSCVNWGIPFETDSLVLAKDRPVEVDLGAVRAQWLVFNHVTDLPETNRNITEFIEIVGMKMPMYKSVPMDVVADYVFVYADGSEARAAIKWRHQISPFTTRWGDNCFVAVSHFKTMPTRWAPNDKVRNQQWGFQQTQATHTDRVRVWINWLWAWENPHPRKAIAALRVEPKGPDAVIIFGISAGDVDELPVRWKTRRKALLTLPEGEKYDPSLRHHGTKGLLMEEGVGGYKHIKMDMGQIISVQPRAIYPNDNWSRTKNNDLPELSKRDVVVEYASHPDAHFHLSDGSTVWVKKLQKKKSVGTMRVVATANKKVRFRAVDKATGRKLPVKLHIHGESGEYLPAMNRHRIPNPNWFQDYSVDYIHKRIHFANYMDGEADILLPRGKVYVEVSKGFEVSPVRKAVKIGRNTEEIVIELDNVIDWRSKGWVTADTHVHFLSPQTAKLEGAAEGVNIINLLASQWGELFTNLGDFDGKTTIGADEKGEGEWLVRVGTENRQGVLGHISLLGYDDKMILPLCADGPMEAAMGDPVNALLTDWAARCKAQNGTVIIPHYPSPHAEHSAAIVSGNVDGVELTSLAEQARGGLSAYALADWYRYLNCGYFVAAVGGTDKMATNTAVGAGRTYARLEDGEPLTYQAWQRAVARGQTFVSMGPLVDMTLEGNPPGARLRMARSGGRVDIVWSAESIVLPMTRAELIVNGEVVESQAIDGRKDSGHWNVRIDKSSWFAILIRCRGAGKAEVISAHTSPVMIEVAGTEFMSAADAVSILEQIEGSIAHFDTIGTRADAETYKRLRLMLTSVHRELHNRLHAVGIHHDHTVTGDHKEHH